MKFLELAQTRYTTKRYDAGKKVSDTQIQELQEILRLSPSSINSQPWKFTFIGDESLKKQLASVSFFNEEKINAASHVIVFSVLDDIDAFETRIKDHLPEGAVAYFQNMVKPKGEAAIKNWMQHQVYLSLGFFLSACAEMQIDSTPMEGIDTAAYDRIVGLQGYKTLFAVAIGYRDTEDPNQPTKNPKKRLPLDQVVSVR